MSFEEWFVIGFFIGIVWIWLANKYGDNTID